MPMIASPMLPLCWISEMTVPTSAARAAQPAIAPMCVARNREAVGDRRGLALEDQVGRQAASATPK